MSFPVRRVRRLVPVLLTVLVRLCVGGALGPFAGRLGEVATDDQAAFLPRSAESTEVIAEQKAFQRQETLPVITVWTAEGDGTVVPRRADATRLRRAAGHPRRALPAGPRARTGRRGARLVARPVRRIGGTWGPYASMTALRAEDLHRERRPVQRHEPASAPARGTAMHPTVRHAGLRHRAAPRPSAGAVR